MAQAFASLLGTTATEGGYIAGAIFATGLFIAFMIIGSRMKAGPFVAFAGLVIGSLFSWFMGWWPPASIILATILLVLGIVLERG